MNLPPGVFEFGFAVAGTHPALPGHFPGHPIVPGVLLLDHVLTGIATEMERAVSVLQQVKFSAPLLPDEPALATFEVSGDSLKFAVRARRAATLVTLASGSLRLAERPQPPPANAAPASGSAPR